MSENLLENIKQYHQLMNEEKGKEANDLVSDDFFAVFCLGDDQSYETYQAEAYRAGNLEALEYYKGKRPRWDYHYLSTAQRSEYEVIVSSEIDFYLDSVFKMKALCMEIYRNEQGTWKLLRQYMEKFNHALK